MWSVMQITHYSSPEYIYMCVHSCKALSGIAAIASPDVRPTKDTTKNHTGSKVGKQKQEQEQNIEKETKSRLGSGEILMNMKLDNV